MPAGTEGGITVQAATLGGRLARIHVEIRKPVQIWMLVAGIGTAGIALTASLMPVSVAPATEVALPWWALAILFYLAELRVMHLQFQREAHSFTLSEIPLVLGLFFSSPVDLVLAAAIGGTAGLLIHRRPAPVKLAFNSALFVLGTATAAATFGLLAPTHNPLDPVAWLATMLATLATSAVGLAAVNTAIWLAQGRSDRKRMGLAVRFGLLVSVTNACLTLIAITLLFIAPGALWLVAVPIVLAGVAWRSYRAHLGEREQRDNLELLYGTTRILHGGTDVESAVVALLTEARRSFRAEFAEIVLFTGERGDAGLRTLLGPDERVETMASVRLDPKRDSLRQRAARERAAFLCPPLATGATASDLIGGQPLRDAMVAPLIGERSLIGTFVIANRQGALGSFSADELRLFQTLANHAGVALENGRLGRSLKDLTELEEQLRHQALHDGLTGLGNRELFLERVESAIERGDRDGAVPVVLFIDLDDFKSVNDTVGHAGGDVLLRFVADAIRGSIRPADLPVRLSGDEFAVLVADGRDIGVVIGIAERIIEAIGRPVEIDGRWISTSASIGIATRRTRSGTANELLRHADVAMYTAKARGKGRFSVFDPSMEMELSDRQQLRADLAVAIAREQLTLRYQPMTDLRSRKVIGFEALLRWNHPTRGELAPQSFIGLAEESGLIVPIGRWVLHEACRHAVDWSRNAGRAVTVSVNVSVRQLVTPDFVADVAAVLRAENAPGAALTLEFKEAQVMVEDTVIASRLRELKQLGISLAIDGFGSGFSSVRYLGRYPVDMIKMARPVVATMNRSAEDARIAQAIVALAHSLRLTVVAEGIENPQQLERVRTLQCDRGQGFFLSRPLDTDGASALLGLAPAHNPVGVASAA